MRPLVLLRPEPGLSRSAEAARSLGLRVIEAPLFEIEPVEWRFEASPPDAMLLTSANAVRHAGPGLAQFLSLPVYAVGTATAAEARRAGFDVTRVGEGSAEELLGSIEGRPRLLWLAGEDRTALDDRRLQTLVVYRAVERAAALPDLVGTVVAVHSARAGRSLSDRVVDRSRCRVAAISDGVASAVGTGWEEVAIAKRPDDATLLALAARLCHTSAE